MRIFSFFSKSIFPILLVNFIGILGYSIVIPILIFIVTDLGGNGFIYGILGAMYPFFQFIGAPILGRLSDRIGRKKVLVISQAGTFVAWLLFLIALMLPEIELWSSNSEFSGNYVMTLPLILIFVARIFDGFTGGNISVANAYLSDISTDNDRDKNFGMMGASTSLGFVLGPAVAGILASTILGETLPILLAAVVSLIAILVIFIRLPESNPCMVDTGNLNLKSFRRFFQVEHKDCFRDTIRTNENDNTYRNVLKQRGIPLLFTIYFLTFLGFSLFYAGLPIYASTILEWTAIDLGIFLAYSSFIMILVQGPLLSFLSGKIPNMTLVTIGTLLLSVSFFLLSNPNIIILYIANTLLSLGNGLMWPSFLSLLSKTGNSTMQGAIQGYGNSMGSLASIFGLVIGGIMFERINVTIFIIGAGVFLLIFMLLLINYIQTKRTLLKIDEKIKVIQQ